MKLQFLFIACLGILFMPTSSFAKEKEKVEFLKAIKFDAETTSELKNVDFDFLKLDEKGFFRVTKGYSIVYYPKNGTVLFVTSDSEITTYDDKKDMGGGITVHCSGCSNGCRAESTKRGKITHYYCSPCGERGRGCMGAVTVEKKKIVDRESIGGGYY